jgi:hypothetical protein
LDGDVTLWCESLYLHLFLTKGGKNDMDDELFNGLVASCNEAIDNESGKITLNSTLIEVPDDEILFYTKYNQLSTHAKRAMHVIVDEILHVQ